MARYSLRRATVETILQDVRYAVRALAKAPAFTAVALVTLATAIGANATVFSFVNALLLSPPAGVRDPGSLIAIYTSDFSSGPYGESSLPDYESIRTDTTAFAELAALREEAATLVRFGDAAERVRTVAVSGEFFAIVGVRPLAGRLIARPDTSPDQPNVAVLGHALWQRAFGGDPAAVGTTLTANGVPYHRDRCPAARFHRPESRKRIRCMDAAFAGRRFEPRQPLALGRRAAGE